MDNDNDKMPTPHIEELMAEVERIIASRTGNGDDALIIQLREYYRYHFRWFFTVATMWTDAEKIRYAGELLSDENSLNRVLVLAWAGWRQGKPILDPLFQKMTPGQWLAFKRQFDDFIFCRAGAVWPTDPKARLFHEILVAGELSRFLNEARDTAERFNAEVLTLAALHGAYQLGGAKFAVNEADYGQTELRGFWDSGKTIEEQRAALGDRRSVFDAILAEQKKAGEKIDEINADARRGADAAEGARAGVSFLVHDRKGRQAANSKRGKESRKKAVLDAENQRAKGDLGKALKRVHERVTTQGEAVMAACRWVCLHFATLGAQSGSGAKKYGQTYLPLTKADGKPLKPESLARYYREKHPNPKRRGKAKSATSGAD